MARAEQPTATASRASRRAKVEPRKPSAPAAAGEAAEPSSAAQLVVLTGLSGAGKSQASKLFEDLGYYCLDNLPPELLDGFLALRAADPARYHRVALVLDIRAGDPAPPIRQARDALAAAGSAMQVIFLDATDAALISRFSETRHRHPLQSRSGVQAGIAEERRRLTATRELADHVVDTSGLSIGQLKERLVALLPSDAQADAVQIDLITFGFKHGIPLEADLVFDVRFLTNPYWEPQLKPLSGLEEPVRDFVMKQPTARRFLDLVAELLELTVPAYREEGRARLTVALGCTGGQHRSIVLAEELAGRLRASAVGTSVTVFHRELER
ncbi:MAG TPA: RNase adapter RapZ [Candidatus Limnocylindria bacterium]|nr:RNase adapter RapZ [Candidatus Limnocylindria bacterium]